jgi:hypothetical protein
MNSNEFIHTFRCKRSGIIIILRRIIMATSQKKNTWVLWVVLAVLLVALLLPLIVKVGGGYYRWGFGKSTKVVSTECPECPVCPDCVCGETSGNTGAVIPPATDYVCNAVDLGNGGSVGEAGECSFCTINYSYPGDVIIAEEQTIAYSADAWVWQYNKGDIDGFRECIKAQPFYTDPDYSPIWP